MGIDRQKDGRFRARYIAEGRRRTLGFYRDRKAALQALTQHRVSLEAKEQERELMGGFKETPVSSFIKLTSKGLQHLKDLRPKEYRWRK